MALDGLEKAAGPDFPIVRYADDYVVLGKSKELLISIATPLIEKFLAGRGVCNNQEKTSYMSVSDGFDYLGFNFREYGISKYSPKSKGSKRGIFLIKPAKKKVMGFCAKLRTVVKNMKHNTSRDLIAKLNHMLRGWANYYKFTSASKTFKYVSHKLNESIVQWVRNKQPKGIRVGIEKFFTTVGGNKWVFTYTNSISNKTLFLFQIGYVKIVRHSMCKIGLNSCLPEARSYFLDRKKKESEAQIEWGSK